MVACGSQKKIRDCDAYANKVADLSDPAPGNREGIVASIIAGCERGWVPDREIACVAGATSRDELIQCSTGRPPSKASDLPPPPKGTNAVTLFAAQNAEGFHPINLAFHEDQRTWFEGLKTDVAACATDEVYEPPREYVLIVTFSPETPAVSLGDLPTPLAYCVKRVLSRRQPASVGNGPAEFYMYLGK